ncbi:unnamed protein product [Parnassius mnemosyne]|uniref:Uncharacterized protein n=1 Tax=Parnassius mnemosyne TaxID=213953 RepID=A0AAV1MBE3_9NEOP
MCVYYTTSSSIGTDFVDHFLIIFIFLLNLVIGVGKGEIVIIPRIPIIPTDLPFQFKRLQFPIKFSFAMTINKAQGQTLQVAGVNLEKPCFSHGQLYVACSRVSNAQNLHILCPNGKTYSIVYSSVLK